MMNAIKQKKIKHGVNNTKKNQAWFK